MDRCDLSIVIVNWNTRQILRNCLESIPVGISRFSWEVIVVDNGSTDGSPAMVQSEFPRVKLIPNERNLGFAAANNIGIRRSQGRFVALINSDVVLLPGSFDRLLEQMELHPEVGIIGPKILWPDKTLQNSCRKFPSLWNHFCAVTGLRLLLPRSGFFSGEHMRYFAHDRACLVDYLVGCFLVVRHSAINEVGLMDERFFIYAEEVDWCRRFWNAKWQIRFFPDAQAIHVGRGSSSSEPVRFALEQERAVLQYWAKHHSSVAVACLYSLRLFQQVAGLLMRLILYLAQPKRRQQRGLDVMTHLSCLRKLLGLGLEFSKGTLGRTTCPSGQS